MTAPRPTSTSAAPPGPDGAPSWPLGRGPAWARPATRPLQLEDLLTKTCVIGLSYVDRQGELMKQAQYAGSVVKVDREQGISVRLRHTDAGTPQADFILPPNLDAWFKAPPGRYRHEPSGVDIENPDYVVTWNIHRTQDHTVDGQHEWWEWVPNVEPPQVGSASP